MTCSRVDGPNDSSSFCPGAGVKITSSVTSPGASSVGGRSVRIRTPSAVIPAAASAPGASRVSRCAADSTTTTPPSGGHHDVARLGQAGRDRVTTDRCRPRRAARCSRTAPLYVSATSTEPSGSAQTPERVLEQRGRGRPVHQAEVEQALADGGVHLAVGDPADRRRLAVGDPQPVARDGQPGRLRHPDLGERAVLERLDGGAGVDAGGTL